MTTNLQQRFDEKFPPQKLFVRRKAGEFSELKGTDEILAFIAQEFELAAQAVEKNIRTDDTQMNDDHVYDEAICDAAAIIRNWGKEL